MGGEGWGGRGVFGCLIGGGFPNHMNKINKNKQTSRVYFSFSSRGYEELVDGTPPSRPKLKMGEPLFSPQKNVAFFLKPPQPKMAASNKKNNLPPCLPPHVPPPK